MMRCVCVCLEDGLRRKVRGLRVDDVVRWRVHGGRSTSRATRQPQGGKVYEKVRRVVRDIEGLISIKRSHIYNDNART